MRPVKASLFSPARPLAPNAPMRVARVHGRARRSAFVAFTQWPFLMRPGLSSSIVIATPPAVASRKANGALRPALKDPRAIENARIPGMAGGGGVTVVVVVGGGGGVVVVVV